MSPGLPRDAAPAVAGVRYQRLVKGDSDADKRALRNDETVMAALADEHGRQLDAALQRHAAA